MSNGSPDYTRRVILYAWDGTAFVPVLVDEKGNIISVFKGQYGTTLQTVKVDDEGRIIALITDELDVYKNKVIVGNAELAARLGSPKFFDRRGDVVFIDDFSSGLSKWWTTGSGDGNEQLITSEMVRSGGYSVKLVGGSTTPWYSYMRTAFPYPVLSKWGFEIHFCYTVAIDKMIIEFIHDDADDSYESSLQWDYTNPKLQYRDFLGTYRDTIVSFSPLDRDNLFHVLKLVVDLETHKYHRLIYNEETYDLSDYAVYKGGSQGDNYCEIRIWLYSRDENNDYVHIDNVIVTQNEP